jgi:outer membrane protein assembly factor BamD
MKKKLTVTWTLLMIVLLFSAGCKKKSVSLNPQELGSDKQIYEKAKARIKRDPERARLLFKEVMHLYPDSIYASRAKIGIADSYFKQKDSSALVLAAAEYQEYVNLYPNSPDAVYAKYQIAMCYIRQMKKAGRDQTNTHQAIKALESMIKQYPGTNEAEEAKKQLEKARQRLAEHYYGIGKTNLKLNAYKGAINRFKQVIDNYPDFKGNDKLFFYTGKCYYAIKDYDSAISFFQKIVNSYPKSKMLKKASKMIKIIAQLQSQVPVKEKQKTVKGDQK